MKLGLSMGYVLGADVAEFVALAQEAERLGFSVAWAAEAYGSDAPTVLSYLAANTSRMDIGAAVMQIPGRTPAMTAMTAATLDLLSGGRFRLGLGVSGPQVSEGWHGVRFDKPLARTREYVAIVRQALARQTVRHEGEFFTLPLKHNLTVPGARLGGGLPYYNLYETREGWLAVAALEPHFWARLQELLSLSAGTYEELQTIFLARKAREWAELAAENRLPLAVVKG